MSASTPPPDEAHELFCMAKTLVTWRQNGCGYDHPHMRLLIRILRRLKRSSNAAISKRATALLAEVAAFPPTKIVRLDPESPIARQR